MAKITIRPSLWFRANEPGFLQKDVYGRTSFSGKTFAKEIANLKKPLTASKAMPQPEKGDKTPEKHGPWTILRRKEVYRDAWINVHMDNVLRPDGAPGTYSTVQIKPGVCVIPVADDGTCYLTKEFHYAVGRDTIEGISGGIEDGETPEIAATRELEEEVGIVAGKLVSLGVVDPLTAALRSPTKMFLATALSFTQAKPESTECIERVEMPFTEVLRMVIANEITHAPSCVAILKASLILNPMRQA